MFEDKLNSMFESIKNNSTQVLVDIRNSLVPELLASGI